MAPLKVTPPCGKEGLGLIPLGGGNGAMPPGGGNGAMPPGGGNGGNLRSGLFLKLKNRLSRKICEFVERSTSNSTKHRGIKFIVSYDGVMKKDKKSFQKVNLK